MSIPIIDLDDLIRITDNALRAKLAYKRARERSDPLLFLANAEYRAAGRLLEQYMREQNIRQVKL